MFCEETVKIAGDWPPTRTLCTYLELPHDFQTPCILDFWISPKLQKTTKIDQKVAKTNRKALQWTSTQNTNFPKKKIVKGL